MPTLAEQLEWWVKQAEHDLGAAKTNRANGLHDVCALMCQQSAEKILKALYMKLNQATPPKIHHCGQLARTLGAPQQLGQLGDRLESKYMASRYPDAARGVPFEQFQDSDSERLIEYAEEIRKWVLPQLNPAP
jgi:HEPN domain-containing protein